MTLLWVLDLANSVTLAICDSFVFTNWSVKPLVRCTLMTSSGGSTKRITSIDLCRSSKSITVDLKGAELSETRFR